MILHKISNSKQSKQTFKGALNTFDARVAQLVEQSIRKQKSNKNKSQKLGCEKHLMLMWLSW